MRMFPCISIVDVFPAIVGKMNFVTVRHEVSTFARVFPQPFRSYQRLCPRFLQQNVSMFERILARSDASLDAVPCRTLDSMHQKEAFETHLPRDRMSNEFAPLKP